MLQLALGHPARFQLSTEDFCLHLPGKHGHLLLLANAYDGGFSIRFPRGSRLFLELFREAWSEQAFLVDKKPRRALRLSFCRTARRYLAKTRSWLEDDEFGGISATAAAVYITGQRAICCWVGTQHAGVIQHGRAIVENVIDTFGARTAPFQQVSGSPGHTFSISDRDDWEPQMVDWHLPPDGEVVLALKAFPNRMSLQELLPLLEFSVAEAERWCQENDTGFYCLMKWVVSGD